MKGRADRILALLVLCIILFCPIWNSISGSTNPFSKSKHETCKDGVCLKIEVHPPFIVQQQTPVTLTVTSKVDYTTLMVGLASGGAVRVAKETYWKFPIQAGERRVLIGGTALVADNGWGAIYALVWDRGSVVVDQEVKLLVNPNGGDIDPIVIPDILGH